MRHYTYRTQGVCSQKIDFDVEEDGSIHNVSFLGGCNGNLGGISRLVEGMSRDKVIELLRTVDCNGRGTSCPAQLAQALLRSKEA